jgi:RNA polymerase sigma factor (sigma-70 family)
LQVRHCVLNGRICHAAQPLIEINAPWLQYLLLLRRSFIGGVHVSYSDIQERSQDFVHQSSRRSTISQSIAANLRPPRAREAIEAALNRHYQDFMRYLVRRLKDRATAEDVLQNFCVRVLTNSASLRENDSAVAWLYTVLRSVLTDHYRREATRRRHESGYAEQRVILGEDTVEHEDPSVICTCVRSLMPELRPDYAQILFRVDIHNEPRQALGAELGISAENLRVRLHRARQAMQKILKSYCESCCDQTFDDCSCDSAA